MQHQGSFLSAASRPDIETSKQQQIGSAYDRQNEAINGGDPAITGFEKRVVNGRFFPKGERTTSRQIQNPAGLSYF